MVVRRGVDVGLGLKNVAVNSANSSLGTVPKPPVRKFGRALREIRKRYGARTNRSRVLLGRLLRAALLFGPSLALILLFSYYPAVRSLVGGFTQWDGFNPAHFNGLENYRQYFASPTFYPSSKTSGY